MPGLLKTTLAACQGSIVEPRRLSGTRIWVNAAERFSTLKPFKATVLDFYVIDKLK